jgi:hypothetical protein
MSPHVPTTFGDLGDSEFLRVSGILKEHASTLAKLAASEE